MSNIRTEGNPIMLTPVADILNTNALILEADKLLDEALNLMKEKNARCILVSHIGEIMGIVSETDIVFKVAQKGRSPHKVRLREIMTMPIIAIHPQTTFAQALAIMNKRDVRQLMVHAYSAVLGIVTKEDIVSKINKTTLNL